MGPKRVAMDSLLHFCLFTSTTEWFFPCRNIRWLGSVMLLIQSYILGTLSVSLLFWTDPGDITITCSVFFLWKHADFSIMIFKRNFWNTSYLHILDCLFSRPLFWETRPLSLVRKASRASHSGATWHKQEWREARQTSFRNWKPEGSRTWV